MVARAVVAPVAVFECNPPSISTWLSPRGGVAAVVRGNYDCVVGGIVGRVS
jgi:hypothetical protein